MTARDTREYYAGKKAERLASVTEKRTKIEADQRLHRDDLNKRLARRVKNVSETKET